MLQKTWIHGFYEGSEDVMDAWVDVEVVHFGFVTAMADGLDLKLGCSFKLLYLGN